MARLIDADELKKTIVSQYGPQATPDGIMKSGVLGAILLIEAAPTVDAEPVRYGEWIDVRGGYLFECSKCKTQVNSKQFKSNLKYCPNCGAKMYEEGKNERI